MAENLGAIRYDVEVNTANMLKAEGQIDKSIQGIVQGFDKADKAVREFVQTQKSLGRTINSMGQVMSKNGEIVSGATVKYRQLAATAQQGFTNLNTRINGATASMRGFGGQLGNVSYQLQDIAVQAQMGINPMIIMSQQLPQLVGGFGAWGAAIGAVVAVAGLLGTSLIDTTTNLERMEKSIERVKAVMTVGAGGVASYTEEMDKLRQASETLTKIRLLLAIEEQKAALESAVKGMQDTIKNTRGTFETFGDQMENLFDLEVGDAGFREARQALIDFNMQLSLFSRGKGDIDSLEAALLNLTSQAVKSKEGRDAIDELATTIAKFREGKITLEALNRAINESGSTATQASDKYTDMVQALVQQSIELKAGSRAAYEYSLRLQDLTDEQIANLMVLYDSNAAQEENNRQKEEAIRKEERLAEAIKKRKEAESRKEERGQEREQQQGVNFAQGIIGRGMSESERFEGDMMRLELLRETDLENRKLYDQAIISLAEQRAERLEALNDSQAALQAQQTDFILSSASNLFGGMADIMKQSEGEQSEAYKTMFKISKGFAIAQSAINLVTSISQASTLPWPANLAAMAAAAANGASLVSQIKGSNYAGGRQFGGPVSAGNMYRVGEGGAPEIYSQNGKNYMIPGDGGKVTSNKDAFGSVNWQINVSNNSPERAYVTIDEVNRAVDVKIGKEVSGIRSGSSRMAKAINSNIGSSTKATRM